MLRRSPPSFAGSWLGACAAAGAYDDDGALGGDAGFGALGAVSSASGADDEPPLGSVPTVQTPGEDSRA